MILSVHAPPVGKWRIGGKGNDYHVDVSRPSSVMPALRCVRTRVRWGIVLCALSCPGTPSPAIAPRRAGHAPLADGEDEEDVDCIGGLSVAMSRTRAAERAKDSQVWAISRSREQRPLPITDQSRRVYRKGKRPSPIHLPSPDADRIVGCLVRRAAPAHSASATSSWQRRPRRMAATPAQQTLARLSVVHRRGRACISPLAPPPSPSARNLPLADTDACSTARIIFLTSRRASRRPPYPSPYA
ncbi:hypothetical protein C8Q79DRAFT_717098 [Trametes meyenii]|nr:hypothetical protein C8Q79DRAFT_717098 [Trametes meyenii]